MADFKKTVATARAKIAKAELEAFNARLEAIDSILHDASPDDVLTLCRAGPRGNCPDLLRDAPGRIQDGASADVGRLRRHPAGAGGGRGWRGRRSANVGALRKFHERHERQQQSGRRAESSSRARTDR